MQKYHIKDMQESDRLSDGEKQKLIKIKEVLNIIELKKILKQH